MGILSYSTQKSGRTFVAVWGAIGYDVKFFEYDSGTCKAQASIMYDPARNRDEKANYITVEAWNETARKFLRYFEKGDKIFAVGEYKVNHYTAKDGLEKEFKYVAADMVFNQTLFEEPQSE